MNNDAHGQDSGPRDELLAELPPEVSPPEGLRADVVHRLATLGMVTPPAPARSFVPMAPWTRGALTAAAVIVAFFAGRSSLPSRTDTPPLDPSAPPMSTQSPETFGDTTAGGAAARWAFLLYEDERYNPNGLSLPQIDSAYLGWVDDRRAAGVVDRAEKLGATEFALSAGPPVTRPAGAHGPHGILTGIFLVRAPTLEAALQLARETPHWRMGGNVVVRFLEPT